MPQRKRPAPTDRPFPHRTNGYADLTQQLGGQQHEPHVDDRADIAILIAAAERGFRLAVRCTRCQQWLVAPASVRRHLGPVCRRKAVANA
ncbi:DUF6011 domain-containing protein [Mycobacterium marinum]|uniref:DUF6011 domain-containing protein n=1 Tax=Mycobacterium marinum TaxID=1781 RepID=UPI00234165B7|nr:DUF6011 domain-containing protein [Mycobacterium marinum]MDC8992502.1 DUF6011 domain-containing protein [Mycobacterium marinum]WDZ15802.1 DUF6011 domain-containing protein [Mycobacterium marinum]